MDKALLLECFTQLKDKTASGIDNIQSITCLSNYVYVDIIRCR